MRSLSFDEHNRDTLDAVLAQEAEMAVYVVTDWLDDGTVPDFDTAISGVFENGVFRSLTEDEAFDIAHEVGGAVIFK